MFLILYTTAGRVHTNKEVRETTENWERWRHRLGTFWC